MKAMKKVLALIMAGALTLGMGTMAMAEEEGTTTYTDMSTVTVSKTYNVTNTGTTSPAETFKFTQLTCTGVEEAAVGITAADAPVPTIENVEYSTGEAGSANAKKDITITLPTYSGVGIYTYTFSEIDGGTAGVTYRSDVIKLVVTVIEQNGKVRVAAVHTEGEASEGEDAPAKSDDFNNLYSAGSLVVEKNVTGTLGDREKEFTVKVTFTAPEGDTVREAISYTDGTENKTIDAREGWTGSKEVEITLKHEESVTFTNIPYGVTYTVVENDYTEEAEGGYDVASYAFDDSYKKIDSSSENVVITNNKDGDIDTGILLDNMPYITLLILVCGAAVLFVISRRRSMEF